MVRKYSHGKVTGAICLIITIGMGISIFLTYRASFRRSSEHIEQITDLTSDSIYSRIDTALATPIHLSMTMAKSVLLIDWMSKELEYLEDDDHIQIVTDYLNTYQKQNGYEAMFLVSVATGRLYTARGIDRLIDPDDPEEAWFAHTLADEAPYNVNIDVDRNAGASREITIFINYPMVDAAGDIIGIVGVGYRIDHFQRLLMEHEEEYDVHAVLVDRQGEIMVSAEEVAPAPAEALAAYGWDSWEQELMNSSSGTRMFWEEGHDNYIVVQYVPAASWYLIIEHDTKGFDRQIKTQLAETALVGVGILFSVLVVVSIVERRFNEQIVALIVAQEQERQAAFRTATEELYDDIYEFSLTEYCAVGPRTEQYLENLGISETTSYDDALQIIAEKQIKEEYREGFLSIFSAERLLSEFESGNAYLRYECMAALDGIHHRWIQMDAYIHRSPEDQLIHMFLYLKNIDEAKRRELRISLQAELDEMTMTYNKASTERRIREILAAADGNYALFIMDIDNFKQVNDRYGHAFGDRVITEFAAAVKGTFRKGDVIGRVGGDEFVAFIPVPDMEWARQKAAELSHALNMDCSENLLRCKITGSIGVAVAPGAAATFEDLYKNADHALYQTKRRGKNGYLFYSP